MSTAHCIFEKFVKLWCFYIKDFNYIFFLTSEDLRRKLHCMHAIQNISNFSLWKYIFRSFSSFTMI